MCGIAGIISMDESRVTRNRLQKMADELVHRGPDGEGFWINQKGIVGLGHKRLAIIDLSESGAQPMHYLDRYAIVYNGEIYNYIELREILEKKGYQFRTQSDTEVLLAAYDCYKEECLQHFDGMFSFAIWDEKEQLLFAARDRFGERPFYYAFDQKEFLFASERKALWSAGVEKKINQPLLLNYLVTGQTQTVVDKTITYYQDVFSLPPAHFIICKIDTHSSATAHAFMFNMECYWDIDKEKQINISAGDAIDQFKELFFISVQRRLRSDVPLGTSLSGGIDSSSIVSAIRNLQAKIPSLSSMYNQQSFSSVFPGFERDESKYIELVTKKLELKNSAVTPTVDDLIQNLEKLCYYQEEPFSSSSIYAQFKVFELAKQHQVKVLLDGQGADETLAGYKKYIHWYLQELLRTNPRQFFREHRSLKKNGASFDWGWKNFLASLLPAQAANQLEKREIRKLLNHKDLGEDFKNTYFDRQTIFKPLVLRLNDILYFNSCQFGLEELLRYADRNSMANGREIRLPFLSHDLVEFIFSLRSNLKIHDGWSKWLLRESIKNDLPAEVVWRKDKIGYEPPQRLWMENKNLQEYFFEAKRKLVNEKILKPSVLTKKIQPMEVHAAENYDWRYLIAATCMNQG